MHTCRKENETAQKVAVDDFRVLHDPICICAGCPNNKLFQGFLEILAAWREVRPRRAERR